MQESYFNRVSYAHQTEKADDQQRNISIGQARPIKLKKPTRKEDRQKSLEKSYSTHAVEYK